MIFQSEREFQLWDYTIGHAQLLLRSPATAEEPFNIDLMFLGVKRIDIPTRMAGLTLLEPQPSAPDAGRHENIHRLVSGGREYTVIAAAFRIYRNHHDLTESSLEDFSLKPPRDPGELVSHTGLFLADLEFVGRSSV